MKTRILHNPRCGKSRETLKLLEDKGEDPEILEYLKTPLSAEELSEVVRQLGISAEQLIRKGEAIYKEHYKGKELKEEEWIKAMVRYPVLMERPIVIKGGKASIGRPPENVLSIL